MIARLTQIQYASALAGLGNYKTDTFNFTVPAHTLAVNQTTQWSSQWNLNNGNAISSVQVNLTNLETVWRPVSGTIALNIPYNTPQYQIRILTYYSGGIFRISLFVTNQTGSPVNVPVFNPTVRIFQFNAPF